MLRILLLALVILVVAELVACVVLYQWLGWIAIPILLVANLVLVFVLKKVVGRLLTKAFTAPFKAKGAVLRGARADIHAIEAASAPVRDVGEEADHEEPERARVYYMVDVTITPVNESGPFGAWEPGELVLVRENARTDDIDHDDEVGSVHKVSVWQDGGFVDDEGMKYAGPQRLRLHVGVDEDVSTAQFRYYFESFGDLRFPGVIRPV
jgi:hypothetical protein